MSEALAATMSLPPSSPPMAGQDTRKRAGDDHENADAAPKPKRRLLGRSLGSELQEITANSVSNPLGASKEGELEATLAHESTKLTETVSIPTPPEEMEEEATQNTLLAAETIDYEYTLSTNGKRTYIANRSAVERISYERLIAQRSRTADAGRPQKDYYGVNIHELIAQAEAESQKPKSPRETVEAPVPTVEAGKAGKRARLMWTEKYRARKFTDLCGDERTHRQVLRWLKSWDQIVFPGAVRPKAASNMAKDSQEEQHRKILLLTGPPGLGKTTLAHVCAKQAGYECVEVNASDERSASVVKNRIRDCLGTENVRGVNLKAGDSRPARRPGKPVCVILDEVDGVTGSSGSGDGGFMKALVDLVMLDQKNSKGVAGGKRKGDNFKMLRPLILVCNDVYAAPLRPLRAAGIAEIIHVRKPPLEKVIERTKQIFEREGIKCDNDAVRRLCEHTWGVSGRKGSKSSRSSADGDIRSVIVTAEWAATKLSAGCTGETPRLTKQWTDNHIVKGSFDNGNRGLGRGGAREVADRVFMEDAGFGKKAKPNAPAQSQFVVPGAPKPAIDASRFEAMSMLRECVDTTDEHDRIVTELFTAYPTYTFRDDTILTKPNAAYEWLGFHDQISSKIFGSQDWELKPYQSAPTLGFHYLFGNGSKQQVKAADGGGQGGDDEAEQLPFSGPRASYDAYECQKETKAVLLNLHACEDFNIDLKRMFHRPEQLAVDLVPHLVRMLAPEVKPVIVGGKGEQMASVRRESERDMIRRAVEAMSAVGVAFEKFRVEDPRAGNGGFIYRMEPISTLETLAGSMAGPARYAVRQIMQQEHRKYTAQRDDDARRARWRGGPGGALAPEQDQGADNGKGKGKASIQEIEANKVKRDFFGRVIAAAPAQALKSDATSAAREQRSSSSKQGNSRVKIWATFNEGFSDAVRKPITLKELLEGL